MLNNVVIKHSDGGWGWQAYAPYGAILVSAAPKNIPTALLAQISLGGVMLIPVGNGKR